MLAVAGGSRVTYPQTSYSIQNRLENPSAFIATGTGKDLVDCHGEMNINLGPHHPSFCASAGLSGLYRQLFRQ